jgi:hypothetical protein
MFEFGRDPVKAAINLLSRLQCHGLIPDDARDTAREFVRSIGKQFKRQSGTGISAATGPGKNRSVVGINEFSCLDPCERPVWYDTIHSPSFFGVPGTLADWPGLTVEPGGRRRV